LEKDSHSWSPDLAAPGSRVPAAQTISGQSFITDAVHGPFKDVFFAAAIDMLHCGIYCLKSDYLSTTSNGRSKMVIERRQSPRFSVRGNAFAILKSKPDKLVPIVNISLGGMGIGVNGINMNTDGIRDVSRLEILTDDCRFYMDQLAYQLLLPYLNLTPNGVGTLGYIYGVQFIDLMSSQQNRIKHFIRNHTRGGKTPSFLHKFNQHLRQLIGKKDLADACRNIGLQRPSI
jgi:hypothetical protein